MIYKEMSVINAMTRSVQRKLCFAKSLTVGKLSNREMQNYTFIPEEKNK